MGTACLSRWKSQVPVTFIWGTQCLGYCRICICTMCYCVSGPGERPGSDFKVSCQTWPMLIHSSDHGAHAGLQRSICHCIIMTRHMVSETSSLKPDGWEVSTNPALHATKDIEEDKCSWSLQSLRHQAGRRVCDTSLNSNCKFLLTDGRHNCCCGSTVNIYFGGGGTVCVLVLVNTSVYSTEVLNWTDN